MKLIKFKNKEDYIFDLEFENGTNKTIDISALIKEKVTQSMLKTAHSDKDWGCLEFKNGLVDMEPKTLYNYVIRHTK